MFAERLFVFHFRSRTSARQSAVGLLGLGRSLEITESQRPAFFCSVVTLLALQRPEFERVVLLHCYFHHVKFHRVHRSSYRCRQFSRSSRHLWFLVSRNCFGRSAHHQHCSSPSQLVRSSRKICMSSDTRIAPPQLVQLLTPFSSPPTDLVVPGHSLPAPPTA